MHPGYFLPTVAGGLVAAGGAAEVGQRRLAEVVFGLGLICWIVLGSILLARLLVRPALPAVLTPTLAIEVARPPSRAWPTSASMATASTSPPPCWPATAC